MRNRFLTTLVLLALVMSLPMVALKAQTTTLRLAGWASSPEEDAALQKMLDAFMKANPDIKVEFQPSTTYGETMQTAFASGDYPEVFYVNADTYPTWIDAGVLADGSEKITDQEDIFPALRGVFTKDGKLTCAPKDFSTLALQFNKDMFDKAGIAYPTADWKWEDLRAAAEKLTTEVDGKKVVGLVLPADLNRWLPFVYQNGGELFDKDGKYALNSDKSKAAIEFFLKMVEDGIAAPSSAIDSGWGGEALGTGRAAMVMEGNWVIQFLLTNYPDLKWGISELPAGPDGTKATMTYTVCYAVGAKHADNEAAWKLANFLTGKEGAMMVADSGFGVMPARASATEAWMQKWQKQLADLKLDDLTKQLSAFTTGVEYAHPWQLPAGWGKFNDTFNASLQEAYSGNKLVDDVLADVDKVATELQSK